MSSERLTDIHQESFVLNTESEKLVGTRFFRKKSTKKAIVLHGAGKSTKERAYMLCKGLANKGYECFTFDFSGHGESSNNTDGSIQKRISEALHVYDAFCNSGTIIVGLSMSVHVAVELATLRKAKGLIPLSPAMYSRNAINTPFGNSFSEIIRQNRSWEDSDIPTQLQKLQIPVVAIYPEFDPIIERVITQRMFSEISQEFLYEIILNAPHTLGSWMNENPAQAFDLAKKSIEFIESHPETLPNSSPSI